MDMTIETWFAVWNVFLFPFLIWWMVSSAVVILLAEIAHRIISERQVALQAFLWKLAIIVCLLLPVSYLLNPNPISFSMGSFLSQSEAEIEKPLKQLQGNLHEQWNQKLETQLERDSKPIGMFENRMELPTLQTLYRNLSGYRPEEAANNQKSYSLSTTAIHLSGIIYFAGMLGMGMIAVMLHMQTRRFLSKTRSCTHPAILDSVKQLASMLNVRRNIHVRVTEENVSPSALGCFKLYLIVPSFMVNKWDPRELQPILSHEINHFRYVDALYMHLMGLLSFLFWCNPFLYWLRKRTDETREALADAKAIEQCAAVRDYAELILKLAEQLTKGPTVQHINFFTKHGKRILDRFSRILTFDKPVHTECSWGFRSTISMVMVILLLVLSGFRITTVEWTRDLHPMGTVVHDTLNDRYRLEAAEEYLAYLKAEGSFSFSAKIKMKTHLHQTVRGWGHIFVGSDFSSEGILYASGVDTDSLLSIWQGKVTLDGRIPEGHIRGGFLPSRLHEGRVKVVRQGDRFSTYYYNTLIQDWLLHDSVQLKMEDPVYVGIGIWSDDLRESVIGYFSEIEFKTLDDEDTKESI